MFIHECEKCGARYEVKDFSLAMRDKDSIECNHCGELIIRWNGGHYYSATEISGPTKEYK